MQRPKNNLLATEGRRKAGTRGRQLRNPEAYLGQTITSESTRHARVQAVDHADAMRRLKQDMSVRFHCKANILEIWHSRVAMVLRPVFCRLQSVNQVTTIALMTITSEKNEPKKNAQEHLIPAAAWAESSCMVFPKNDLQPSCHCRRHPEPSGFLV